MVNRVIFISSKCEHCGRLLIGIQQYDILKRTFSIVNIDTEPFPNYIKSVPSLLINNQIVEGEQLFEYMGRIVDASGEISQEEKYHQQHQQHQQQQPQHQQPQHQQPQHQQHQQHQQQQQDTMKCSASDEIMGYCTNGSCIDYSTITETSDDYTKSFHKIDSNLEFLEGQGDMPGGTMMNGSRVQLSKDDTFDRSEKRKEFDSDYEKLMNDRKL